MALLLITYCRIEGVRSFVPDGVSGLRRPLLFIDRVVFRCEALYTCASFAAQFASRVLQG